MNTETMYAQVVQDPETQEYLLTFPEQLMKNLDWQPGDTLDWKQVGDNFVITNSTAEKRKQ